MGLPGRMLDCRARLWLEAYMEPKATRNMEWVNTP